MRVPLGRPPGPRRSRVDLLRNDVEDDVLVPTAHHGPQRVVSPDGCADVVGRGDACVVDANDDVALLEARAGGEMLLF